MNRVSSQEVLNEQSKGRCGCGSIPGTMGTRSHRSRRLGRHSGGGRPDPARTDDPRPLRGQSGRRLQRSRRPDELHIGHHRPCVRVLDGGPVREPHRGSLLSGGGGNPRSRSGRIRHLRVSSDGWQPRRHRTDPDPDEPVRDGHGYVALQRVRSIDDPHRRRRNRDPRGGLQQRDLWHDGELVLRYAELSREIGRRRRLRGTAHQRRHDRECTERRVRPRLGGPVPLRRSELPGREPLQHRREPGSGERSPPTGPSRTRAPTRR